MSPDLLLNLDDPQYSYQMLGHQYKCRGNPAKNGLSASYIDIRRIEVYSVLPVLKTVI
jgi:hypothetical protein